MNFQMFLTWVGFSELLVATSAPVSASLSVAVPPISSHTKVGVMVVLESTSAATSTSIPVTTLPSSMVVSIAT